MTEINKENLEKALNNSGNGEEKPQMSKEAEIGFHQGALNTLVNERNELLKMAGTTEQIMQAHLKRLEELGIEVNKQ